MIYIYLFNRNLLTNIHKPFYICIMICNLIIECLFSYSISFYVVMLIPSLFFLYDITGKVTF